MQQFLIKVQKPHLIYISEKGLSRIFFKKTAEIFRGQGELTGNIRKGNRTAEIYLDILHTLFNPVKIPVRLTAAFPA